MSKPKVLISDALSPAAVQIFKDRGIEVDFQPNLGKDKDKLVEITGKTLGVIGCGNIGSIAADRGIGLRMKVIAYDPFLSPERAKDIGVEKVDIDDLFRRADFITLHTPLTEKTRNIIDAAALAKMKKGVRIINCARGGLVDEQALVNALDSKHVAGAAFDVFIEEPATSNVLFGHPNVICTPHLGAATTEAQENVALQVAEQMSDYLLNGAISNAVNFPSITAEEAPKLKPFIALAEKLGSFAGQLTEFGHSMIYVTNEDKPGFIGHFAGILGDASINIATFHLGRNKQGGDAIALVEVDGAVPAEVLAKVQALAQVKQAKALVF